jgi:hypothetical protein
MKLTMRTLGYGLGCGVGIGAIGAGLKYWRKHRGMSPEDLPIAGQMVDTDLRDVAMHSGIADVDPQYLSHVAGEGIDLDLDTAAHDVLVEVRDRMPH